MEPLDVDFTCPDSEQLATDKQSEIESDLETIQDEHGPLNALYFHVQDHQWTKAEERAREAAKALNELADKAAAIRSEFGEPEAGR